MYHISSLEDLWKEPYIFGAFYSVVACLKLQSSHCIELLMARARIFSFAGIVAKLLCVCSLQC